MTTEKKEIIFPKGISSRGVSEKAPDYVKDNISIKVSDFLEWIQGEGKQYINNGGWLNLVVKTSREGKRYMSVDMYEPKPKKELSEDDKRWLAESRAEINRGSDLPDLNQINPEDIPF